MNLRVPAIVACTIAGTAFADRPLADYNWPTAQIINLPNQGASDYSGVTWVEARNAYYIVDNRDDDIYEYDAGTFAFRRAIRTNIGLSDLEGISHMYGDRFALVDEGANELVVIEFDAGDTSIEAANVIYRLTAPITPVANKGLEGVSFDPLSPLGNDRFFMVKEKPPALYQFTQNGAMQTYSLTAHMVDAAGLAVSPDGASLLVVSQEARRIHRLSRTGRPIGYQSIAGLFVNPEGIDFSADGNTLVITGEPRQLAVVDLVPAPPPPPGEASWSGQITGPNDDAEFNGTLILTSKDLDLGEKDAGLRFTNVAVPAGSTIRSARIIVDARRSRAALTRTRISGVNTVPSVDFSQVGNGLTSPNRSNAQVDWQTQNWTVGDLVNSPDLSAIIQELIDNPNWASGHALSLIVEAISGKQEVMTVEDDPARSARLELTYDPPANDLPIISAPIDGLPMVLDVIASNPNDDAEFEAGAINLGSSDLDIGQHPAAIRFANLALPAGARITSSQLEVISRRDRAAPTEVQIRVSDALLAQSFNQPANVLNGGEALAFPSVTWTPAPWLANAAYGSPELRTLVVSQAHANSWQAGQHLAFLFTPITGKREIKTVEASAADAPGLRINYIAPTVLRSATYANNRITWTTWQEDGVASLTLRSNGAVIGTVSPGAASYTLPVDNATEFFELDVRYADRIERTKFRRAAPNPFANNIDFFERPGTYTSIDGLILGLGFPRIPMMVDITNPADPVFFTGDVSPDGRGGYDVSFSLEPGRTFRVTE